MSSGILSSVSFAPETVWGTPVTPTKSLAVHPGDGIVANRKVNFPTGIKGTLARNNSGSYQGVATYEGEFEFDYIPGYADYLLKSAIGSSAPTLVETGVYEHTLTETEAKTSLTIEQETTELVYRYAGATATGFTISAQTDNPIVVTVPFKAKSTTTATATTPAYENDPVLPFTSATLSIAGVARPEAENIEITYANGTEFKHALNASIDPAIKYQTASTLTFSFQLYLSSANAAQYVAFLNKTSQTMKLRLEGALIGSTARQTLELDIPVATFTTAKSAINDDLNLIEVTGEAELDPSTGRLFQLKTRNKLANLT